MTAGARRFHIKFDFDLRPGQYTERYNLIANAAPECDYQHEPNYVFRYEAKGNYVELYEAE